MGPGTEIQVTGNLFWQKIGLPICSPILGAGFHVPASAPPPLVPVQCAVPERVQYPCVHPPVSLGPLPVALPCPRQGTMPCLFRTRNDLCKFDDFPAPCHAVFGDGHIMSHHFDLCKFDDFPAPCHAVFAMVHVTSFCCVIVVVCHFAVVQ